MIDYKKRLGQIFRARREELGFSQEYVSGIVMSVRTIQRVENGEYFPSIETLSYLCNRLMLEFSTLLKKMIFYSHPVHDINPAIIHHFQFSDVEIAEIREILTTVYDLEIRKKASYTMTMEILYFSIYFDVPYYLAECIEKVEYLVTKKPKYTKLEAKFLAIILEKNYTQTLTDYILDMVWQQLSQKQGSKLPLIYATCRYYYYQDAWEQIIALTTRVLDEGNFFHQDTNYLPHIYAQRGIARLEKNNEFNNSDLETSRLLCTLFANNDVLVFIDNYQKKSD